MSKASWSEGYATGSGYTHGYYQDLNPRFAAFAMLLEGLDGPPPGPCCELGFGQGLSLAMHAAGDPARRWWGNDFMPAHAAQARGLVAGAGLDAVLGDQCFEDFFARDDLPQFAFIGLHGVWSWISAANRARIAAFLQRRLLPGGVVYISYNCLAGWAPVLPLQSLLRDHFGRASPPGRADARRATEALAFLQGLVAANPNLLAVTPVLRDLVAGWADEPPAYLLHELLNDDWHPLAFTEVAAELEPARLSFAASSDLVGRRADLQYSPAQLALLAQIEDPALREAAQDICTARRFRREYWVRGARPLSRTETARRMREQRVVLALERGKVPTVHNGAHRSAPMPAAPLALLLDLLVQADAPVAIGQVLDQAAARGMDGNEMVALIATQVGAGGLLLAAPADEVEAARAATRRLNQHLLAPHARRAEILHLASPVSGGGVSVSASLQLMLAARAEAPAQPERWADLSWAAMQAEGQQLLKGDQRITDRAAAAALLQPLVQTLQSQALPLLRRLGVVD